MTILAKLDGTSEKHCDILNHIVTHILKVVSTQCASAGINQEKLGNIIRNVVDGIGKWQHNVIGHHKFGGTGLKKFEDELRVRKFEDMQKNLKIFLITYTSSGMERTTQPSQMP